MDFNRLKKLLDEYKEIRVVAFLFVLTIILTIIVAFVQFRNSDPYKKIKIDTEQGLVYNLEIDDKSNNQVPVINIDNTEIKKINEQIKIDYQNFMTSSENIYTYVADKSENYLSILITKSKKDVNYYGVEVSFESYIINLKTREVMSEDEIQGLFSVDDKRIEAELETKFKQYYKELVEKGHIYEAECDYECFTYFLIQSQYLDNIQYYIKEGKLYVYKSFDIYAYALENYFEYEDYEFLIK